MSENHSNTHTATIIPFPRKRGRPKSVHQGPDLGTPELAMKRLLGLTAEMLDLCRERGIITDKQHWCGVHLRWLYTLRNGAPNVRAIDLTHIGGMETKIDDPEWRAAREQEYHDAVKKLSVTRHAIQLMNICIYNERPIFLNLKKPKPGIELDEITDAMHSFRAGLDILVKLWR